MYSLLNELKRREGAKNIFDSTLSGLSSGVEHVARHFKGEIVWSIIGKLNLRWHGLDIQEPIELYPVRHVVRISH